MRIKVSWADDGSSFLDQLFDDNTEVLRYAEDFPEIPELLSLAPGEEERLGIIFQVPDLETAIRVSDFVVDWLVEHDNDLALPGESKWDRYFIADTGDDDMTIRNLNYLMDLLTQSKTLAASRERQIKIFHNVIGASARDLKKTRTIFRNREIGHVRRFLESSLKDPS